ncbi:shufflon protein C [Citrobacter portucalensis]|uniref:shufflon protein C n=1 Tax=Citrobacter portucalensis TaxID=1639133 RepID=UPI003F75F39B
MMNTLMFFAALSANCQSGIWKSGQITFTTQSYTIGKNVQNKFIGIHAHCAWTTLTGSPLGGTQSVFSRSNNEWYVTNQPWDGWASGSSISVTCLNLPGAGI